VHLHQNDSSVPEPKWLTDDMKKFFNYKVHVLNKGLRLTKLVFTRENFDIK
jgi:hypothetical protein